MTKTKQHVHRKRAEALPDQHQNYWQMATIQAAAFGFPILLVGRHISETQGAGSALLSVWIGNLILWLVALATVAMAYPKRKDALENIVGYVGKIGRFLGGVVLFLAIIFWFTLQLQTSASEVSKLLASHIQTKFDIGLKIGVLLGLTASVLSLGGIKLIRWFNTILFPILLLFVIYAAATAPVHPTFKNTWGISAAGIAFTVAATLPGIVNLPTFFRHGKSRTHAFFAITLLTILTAIIESSSIWMGQASSSVGVFHHMNNGLFSAFMIFSFIVLSSVAVNLVNVYFASASWEALFPKVTGMKKYAIVGMVGTILFTIVQVDAPLVIIENIFGSYIANLGLTILMGFLVRRVVTHRERAFEVVFSLICWLIGCMFTTFSQLIYPSQLSLSFYLGLFGTGLSFMIFIFGEESIWSGMACLKDRLKKK